MELKSFMDVLPLLEENITATFLKCTRWQVEETTDLFSCPFHYFCDSTYPGDYPPLVDFLVLSFAAASFLSATLFTLLHYLSITSTANQRIRRYCLPSGPLALPVLLFIFAKGERINTAFPLSDLGPALLLLVQISAVAFRNRTELYITYTVLEGSTISGILHASLYLDSVILPFYTGMDALANSTFSGGCPSCVCRTEALEVGGRMVFYKAWSATMMAVIGTLCSRIIREIFGGERLISIIKAMLETMSWVLIASDSVYLMIVSSQMGVVGMAAAYGGLCVLIILNVWRKLSSVLIWISASSSVQKRIGLGNVDGNIV